MRQRRPAVLLATAVALIAVVPALWGCQTSCTGDARFDGYHCARSNLNSGTYAGQTQNLRVTAASRQAEANSLRRQYNAAQARLRAARANRASSAGDILRLEAEVDALRRAIDRGLG